MPADPAWIGVKKEQEGNAKASTILHILVLLNNYDSDVTLFYINDPYLLLLVH